MANRVVLGNANGEYGLYVSQKDDDVTDPDKQLSFDSRAFSGLPVHAFFQDTLAAPNTTSSSPLAVSTKSHSYSSLGFAPAFALRWNYASDNSSSKAVRVYNPSKFTSQEQIQVFTDPETEYLESKQAGAEAVASASSITVTNYHSGKTVKVTEAGNLSVPSEETGTGKIGIYYAIIIFGVEDFTGGAGL